MKLRLAHPSDARALHALEGTLFEQRDYPLSRRAFYYHIRHSLLCVAEAETGEIAGYALFLIRRRRPKLYSIGVAPAYRGRGVAASLLGYLLEMLEQRGMKQPVLEVRCDNTAAISLYRRFGFRETKRLKAFYRDGSDAWLMEV